MAKAAEKSGKVSAKNTAKVQAVKPKNDTVVKKVDGVVKAKKVATGRVNLQIYIYRVLKQVHPEIGISSSSMSCLNSIAVEVYKKLARSA